MNDLKMRLLQADAQQVMLLLEAALQRYRELFPDWEICVISLHKEEDLSAQLDTTVEVLLKMKEFAFQSSKPPWRNRTISLQGRV